MTRFLFPNFKKKALTFSYDDNTEQDRWLTCIFRFHRLPATFNINTGSFGEKRWIEHCGFYCEYNRVEAKEVKSLYNGFEVASHMVDHVILPEFDKYTFDYQVTADCKKIVGVSTGDSSLCYLLYIFFFNKDNKNGTAQRTVPCAH